jgi:uncharacterized membrane protein YkoI
MPFLPIFLPLLSRLRFCLRRALLPVLLLAGLALPLAGQASERDQDRARAALQAGEIQPLPVIMARVAALNPGHVLEVELERERGRWVYEFKLLQAGGGLLKLQVDAQSGAVLNPTARGADARPGR